jgi:hypothetical protein
MTITVRYHIGMDWRRYIGALVLMTGLAMTLPRGGAAHTIQSVSPLPGSVFLSGQQFNVTVTVTPGAFTSVGVIARNLGESSILSRPPYVFSFVAPSGGMMGPLTLTALGLISTTPPNVVSSQEVVVSVEEAITNIVNLHVGPPAMWLTFIGQQMPLIVSGTYVDGGAAELTQSPNVRYTSGNSSIAQVSSVGLVTAIGPGNTEVTVSYGGKTASIAISVSHSIRGDINADGKVDTDDLNILDSFLNTPVTGPNDARDLNHDGVINALDARILTTLCTYPRCATRQ